MRRAVAALLLGVFSLAALAVEPFDYGAVWARWSVESRRAYLVGLKDGQIFGFVVAGDHWLPRDEFPPQHAKRKTARVRKVGEILLWAEEDVDLEQAMTSLYADSRNRFVDFQTIAALSRDQLGGMDIQSRLLEERARARGRQ